MSIGTIPQGFNVIKWQSPQVTAEDTVPLARLTYVGNDYTDVSVSMATHDISFYAVGGTTLDTSVSTDGKIEMDTYTTLATFKAQLETQTKQNWRMQYICGWLAFVTYATTDRVVDFAENSANGDLAKTPDGTKLLLDTDCLNQTEMTVAICFGKEAETILVPEQGSESYDSTSGLFTWVDKSDGEVNYVAAESVVPFLQTFSLKDIAGTGAFDTTTIKVYACTPDGAPRTLASFTGPAYDAADTDYDQENIIFGDPGERIIVVAYMADLSHMADLTANMSGMGGFGRWQ